jgi:hypothetical protein
MYETQKHLLQDHCTREYMPSYKGPGQDTDLRKHRLERTCCTDGPGKCHVPWAWLGEHIVRHDFYLEKMLKKQLVNLRIDCLGRE